MKPVFSAGLCASTLVAQACGGEKIGDLTVPEGKMAFATVCSVVVNGALLKAGVPMNSRFGGLLQIHDGKPFRFIELINYDGCSLDPSEIFIKARMTSVSQAVKTGNGNILANFREIPACCQPLTQTVITRLARAGIRGVLLTGNVSEPVCEVPVELNRVGMVLTGGLNPLAAVEEAGMDIETHAMSTVLDYKKLMSYEELLK
jgi:repressor of nif and glnA expression